MTLSRRRLILLSLVAMTAVTDVRINGVTRCYPSPTPHPNGRGAFHRSLLSLLDDLPSAAAPTGFASKRTGRAFARGLCFGDPAPGPCLHCLSDAGAKIADQCGNASRRAGFLNDGCFLGYADTNVSSDGIDIGALTISDDSVPGIHAIDVLYFLGVALPLVRQSANGRVPAADATATASNGDTARVLAQCATDRAPAECDLCLSDAVLQMTTSWGLTADGVQGSVAAVLGPDCYLRVEISAPPLREKIRRIVKDHIFLTVFIGFIVLGAILALVAHLCSLAMRKAGN
ncbi:plasmodesmata-located protein 5-like [Aegilops tauschii subsp. strangulata]|uniref:plasmodesmata-located protein 5-like n=1 Tax=Aegilops tauschii subsp. strangulata TaxID=200361 RepID=UPI00098A216D|nr:plasmodesmata-located protein 5-like [Aegilops tauschii subsp. strangulata]